MASLNHKLREERKVMTFLLNGIDKNIVDKSKTTQKIVEKNKNSVKELMNDTKLIFRAMEYKRRMVAVQNPSMKTPMMTLWVDPDRGNFHPVD